MNAAPVIIARQAIRRQDQDQDQDQAAAQVRWMRARRRAARQAGYRGPLTRAELAAQVTQTAQGR